MDIDIETTYARDVGLGHRKRFAQFFTPPPIAELMCRWLLCANRLRTVLDPAFGLGIFARSLRRYREDVVIRGFDVDEKILNVAKKIFGEDRKLMVALQDYMYNDWDSEYDGIVCNPPYFKFHDYDNRGVLREVEQRLGMALNGFTNLYTLFLLKSLHQLAEGGRCAYIVPSEFMNSDYGIRVKQYLVRSGKLRHIFVFDFAEKVFDDALTTSCILFCANDGERSSVGFHTIKSMADLSKIERVIALYPQSCPADRIVSMQEIDPAVKWKSYYQKCNGSKYRGLVPFANFAKVVRGIATGANDYFTFNLEKAREHRIPEHCLLPCVCHSADVPGNVFRSADFDCLREKGKKVFLVNLQGDKNDVNVRKYIAKGEDEGIDRKYLTSCRSPWYALEKRRPAPIWVSVFNRSGLRFIRNEVGASNLSTFHCVYPRESLFGSVSSDLLFAYLLTDTAREIFEDNAREYGNGLQKFEPNDLNNGKMLDLTLLSDAAKKEICDIYSDSSASDSSLFSVEINQVIQKEFRVA